MSTLGALLGAVLGALPGATEAKDNLVIADRDRAELVKLVQDHYAAKDSDMPGKALQYGEKIQDKLASIAKKEKLDDPNALLAHVEDWREILLEAFVSATTTVKITATGSFGLRPVELDSPVGTGVDNSKELGKAFDEKLKAFVSVPRDYKRTRYPVILALHPAEDESGKKIEDMTTSSQLVKDVKDWLAETYPKEILEEAIVVAPVLDLVLVNEGLSATRPQWDSIEGTRWAIIALTNIVRFNLNHDPQRTFLDGHGSGARAVMQFCAQYPSMATGAIVRGPTSQKINFVNCRGKPFLMVGEETRSFCDEWSRQEGYRLTHVDSVDPGAYVQWVTETRRDYCPQKVELHTDSRAYGAAYWLRIQDFDVTQDGIRNAEIIGEVNRQDNEITIETNPKVKEVILYLNDNLVDLDRELKVIHKTAGAAEGRICFQGTKERSLAEVLEIAYYQNHGNFGEAYVTQVRIEL